MESERWRRIEDLCHEALARPAEERAAFLTEACAGDELLERDVSSLLAQDLKAENFMSAPALAGAGSAVLDYITGALVGRRLGGYSIRTVLGVGGMGEVYRAYDDTLGREVAIKVLPAVFVDDPERRVRFEREARLLASLNHPNIAAIYGVEEADGVRGLVLELVEGETLAERIQAAGRDGLPIADVLAIARQIADALDAAHDKGIVHRDLKPANIKITPAGTVKVLDFGLAKAVNAGPDTDSGRSHEGAILGTTAYMSPEQARGQSVDKRADIWAFGCVLYEMLTGRLTFAGDTTSDTIAKILERDPDWSVLPKTTPASIRRLLLRCFVKDPRRRLRDIGDVRIELDAIDELPAAGDTVAAVTRPAKRVADWRPWVALAGLAASVGIWEVRRPFTTPENPLANARFSRLTDWEGSEEGAEISPDGEFVAFLSDRDGEFDIWLSRVGTGVFSNLTRNIPPLASSGFIVRKLGFSSDGKDIWFNPGDGLPPMVMPSTGGTPRPLLAAGTNTPAWSPDGTSLVYVDKAHRDDPIYLADRSGAEARQIFGPGPMKNMNPVWSPDGQWIYFGRGSEPQDESAIDVWRLRPSNRSAQRITTQHLAINFLAPLDRRRLLYVARAEDRSGPWLWSLDVETGASSRVPSGVDQYTSVSASRDGRRIVATVANPSSSLWRVPLLDRPVDERDAEPYTLSESTGMALAPRFGKTSLFYLSARGTADGLWRVQDGNMSQVRRDVDGALSEPVAVSSDGRLAAVVRKDGKRHLSIMSADGTNARTLAASIDIDGAAGQGAADWSPDGARIVTGGRDEKGPALFIIPVDGGAPVRLLEGQWVNPVWSPRGDLIVYAGRSLIGQVELRGVQPDGTPVELPHVFVRPGGYRFLSDGRGLIYVPRIPSLDFWLLDLVTKKTRQLTRLSNRGALRTFDITADGKYLVFDRVRQNSNIVLIDLAK
jgi:serine/threonine protein kinase/Tol biopolymer transport system component